MDTSSLSTYIYYWSKTDNREQNIAVKMGVKYPIKKGRDNQNENS